MMMIKEGTICCLLHRTLIVPFQKENFWWIGDLGYPNGEINCSRSSLFLIIKLLFLVVWKRFSDVERSSGERGGEGPSLIYKQHLSTLWRKVWAEAGAGAVRPRPVQDCAAINCGWLVSFSAFFTVDNLKPFLWTHFLRCRIEPAVIATCPAMVLHLIKARNRLQPSKESG